jgi:hypothetical protein
MPLTNAGRTAAFGGVLAGSTLHLGLRSGASEVATSTVARRPITFTGTTDRKNSVDIEFAAPSTNVTVTGVAIYSAATGGSLLWIIPIANSISLTANSTILRFAANSISLDFNVAT